MIFLLLTALLAGLYIYLTRKADRIIFYPVRPHLPGKLPGATFFLPSGEGKIQALYIPAKDNKDTLLFFHGQGGNITHFAPFAQRYAAHGYGVLLFDYRGFGASEGKLSPAHFYEDGQSALNYLLHAKKIPPQKLVLWGYSMGNAACLHTAVKNAAVPFKAVILQSPFTSAVDMALFRAGGHYLPWSLNQKLLRPFLELILCQRKLNNARLIGRVRSPLLIAYSKADETIPWQMSAALARLAPHGAQAFAAGKGAHCEFGWLEEKALEFLQHT